MKKIILFMFDLGLGGTEKVMVNLANYLNNKNYKVQILTISSIREDLLDSIDPGVEIESLNSSRILFSFFNLFRYIQTNNIDFFLANVWPLTSIASLCGLFSKGFRGKLILVEHCHLGREFAGRSFIFRFLQKVSIMLLYPFSKKVIAVSKGVKDDLIDSKSLKDGLVEVIENPVDCIYSAKQYTNTTIQNWQNFKHAKLISVGNFKPQKNYSYLVETLSILKKKGFLFKHLIIGNGAEMDKIAKEVLDANLGDNIILAGSVNQPLDLIDEANLFILPSSFEGFGLVIVEALSVGTTVVSTDCLSGPAEILFNGELGYLAKLDDPGSFADLIEHAYHNPINPDNLKNRAADFTIEKIGPKYIKLLNS